MKASFTLLFFYFLFSSSFVQSQISEDAYTRYELLDLSSQSFRIIYEVSCVTPNVDFYFNTLRKGSEHKVDEVIDLASGKKLEWTIVNGVEAKKSGLSDAEVDGEYLRVKLANPVPWGSEYRLRIDKTYKDSKSYFVDVDKIVFNRSLEIKRNSVVLPLGYELTKCNYPSQVSMENDGRLKISFINIGPAEVPLIVEGRKLPATSNITVIPKQVAKEIPPGQGRDKSKARLDFTFSERAYQDREIVYYLQEPEKHSFFLFHDYTETKEGTDHYINIVRAGSKASKPAATNLNTGKPLKVETLKGDEIRQRKLEIGEPITDETEIVVIWYNPVKKGESVRLRIQEVYTDVNRYLVHNGDLIFDRSLGRPYNVVVLPEGWFLTSNVIPATISQGEDRLIRLNFVNNNPDEIDVHIKARKK
jgi:hypothetical protein